MVINSWVLALGVFKRSGLYVLGHDLLALRLVFDELRLGASPSRSGIGSWLLDVSTEPSSDSLKSNLFPADRSLGV